MGRPTPLYRADRFTAQCGGARIYLNINSRHVVGTRKVCYAFANYPNHDYDAYLQNWVDDLQAFGYENTYCRFLLPPLSNWQLILLALLNANFRPLGGAGRANYWISRLKLHMDDRTLQQTDRAGATLDIVSPLANPTSPLMFSGLND